MSPDPLVGMRKPAESHMVQSPWHIPRASYPFLGVGDSKTLLTRSLGCSAVEGLVGSYLCDNQPRSTLHLMRRLRLEETPG